jgi:hypothetical protein
MKKNAYFIIFAVILVVAVYFVADMRNQSPNDGAKLTVEDSVMVYDTMEAVDKVASKPKTTSFESDADAIEAIRRCEAEKTGFKACITALQKDYVVTGLVPDNLAKDGFAGFMIFPLQDGDTVILDYNEMNDAQQFIYFGNFESLKKAANAGAFDDTFAERVNAVKKVVNQK